MLISEDICNCEMKFIQSNNRLLHHIICALGWMPRATAHWKSHGNWARQKTCLFFSTATPLIVLLSKVSFMYQQTESWWGILRKQSAQFWLTFSKPFRMIGYFSGELTDGSLIQFCFLNHVPVGPATPVFLSFIHLNWIKHKMICK